MSRVVEAFVNASGTPREDLPPLKVLEWNNSGSGTEADCRKRLQTHVEAVELLEKTRGLLAHAWLKLHAAEWLRLASVAEEFEDKLLGGDYASVNALAQIRNLVIVPQEVAEKSTKSLITSLWDDLASCRAGFEAAARAGGAPDVDQLVDLAKLGAQIASKWEADLDRGVLGMFVDALTAAANAVAYEMVTGEPAVLITDADEGVEQDYPTVDPKSEFDVTDVRE